ncbi:MAG TPA: prephenate dehydrogenase [Planctomycetota bacterium]|nr:prephenate dehydrogenase [Planctomycetota bacterium]
MRASTRDSGPAASYPVVVIAGLGLIGGSLALALKRAGFQGKVLGVSSAATLTEAARLGAIDEGFAYDGLSVAAERADLIVLASPISTIIEHLRALGAREGIPRPGTVVTDVGSTKRAILAAAAESLPRSVHFIGGHPLAGSERRGFAAADPFLFQNAYYVLTPAPGVPPAEVDKLGGFLATTGARMAVLAADDHDRIAAAISHLPQLLAVSLVRFLDDLGANREHGVHLAAGGFRDMTRIASSSYSVWRDIFNTNRDVVSKVLERFLEHTRGAFGHLEEDVLSRSFESAARTRAEIPRDSKGFLHHLWDVLVLVEDKPGIIAGIAAPLAEKGINIKDIEVLKVREGEGGTLRLAFETRELAAAAVEELRRRGYEARERE